MDLPYADEDGAFKLTPLAAEGLANAATFREKLHEDFGESEGDQFMMVMRLIEGRERREMDPPTADEVAALLTDYVAVSTLANMYNLVLRGLVYVDVIEEDGDTQVAFSITPSGIEAIARDGELK